VFIGMIIWINGAFGSGKTQTALEINRRFKNSFIYDPENIGYFLNKNFPKDLIPDNFQDHTLWRLLNFEVIKNLHSHYNGILLIPMTLYDRNYFDEIIGKLLSHGIKVDHYILGADKETLLKRLSSRFDGKKSWPAKMIEICIDGFKNMIDVCIYIDTNKLKISEVVDIITENSKLLKK
jgi:broad-specificity NMP kinase